MHAVWEDGDHDLVETLLAVGANLEFKDIFGATALLIAARYGQDMQIAARLLQAGANREARDVWGRNVWELARYNPHSPDAELLRKLEAGA